MQNNQKTVARSIPAMVIAASGTAAAGPFPSSFPLSSIGAGNGFVCVGEEEGDYIGGYVSGAGDVNGDGVADILVHAHGVSQSPEQQGCAVYVILGGSGIGASSVLLPSQLNGANGFVVYGTAERVLAGPCASAGDVNGDGVDDLIFGSRIASPNGRLRAGESYVVFGKRTSVFGAFPSSLSIGSLNGSNGFVVKGAEAGDYSGGSVSGAGDINGDGVDDIVIGAYRATSPPFANGGGKAYVVFGKNTVAEGAFPPAMDLSGLNGTNGFCLNGWGSCGFSVAGVGDVNHDGIDDVLIGSPHANPALGTCVIFGRNVASAGEFLAVLEVTSLDGTNGFVIESNGECGYSVSRGGDVNADGIDDILFSAPGGSDGAGISFVVFGKDTATHGNYPASFDLATLDGSNGFSVEGSPGLLASGFQVGSAGDVNGDGVDDIMIGAYSGPIGTACFVVYGQNTSVNGPFASSISLAALNGSNGFVANSDATASEFSIPAIAGLGDVNDDGIDDVVVGRLGEHRGSPPNQIRNVGKAYVLFGRASPITCIGDINGDGATTVADFNVLASHFAQSVPAGTNGDLTGDGFVNVADFNVLAFNFGCGAE